MGTPAILLWDQAYNRNGDASLPRAVVNAIRTHMDNHTLDGWVKAETLADYTGLQIRGVRKQIAANVKAGWLEVVESGNSSGKANTYRLTYPKGVLQDTIAQEKGVPEDTPRVSHRTGKGVLQDTPTTPVTSQENFSSKRSSTSPEKGVPQDTIAPEAFFASGDVSPSDQERVQRSSTSESKGVLQDTVPEAATPQPATYTTDPALVDPFADPPVLPARP